MTVELERPASTSTRPTGLNDATMDRLLTRIANTDGEPLTPTAPYDGQPTATIPTSSAESIGEVVRTARTAQQAWTIRPIHKRAEMLLRFHDALVRRQDEVLDLIQWETGKSRFSAWQEVLQVATIARHYARRGAHYLAPQPMRGAIPGLTKVYEQRVPKGVIGVISPWNYPLYLGIGDVLPALLAGNAVVSKADSQTPLTMLWARDVIAESGLPTDLWQIVVGAGSVVGTALIDQVDFVCFTGSTKTGRAVGAQAGSRLIGCSLELGGKNPMIVRADADIPKAVTGLIAAAFANSGQMCISIERVIVDRSIVDEFTKLLAERVAAMKVGQTYDFSVDMGTLTSAAQLSTVQQQVDDAIGKGATIVVGGKARPDIGPYVYEPTVLTDVTPQMTVYAEETFGPVVSILPVDSDDAAVDLANEGNYGLSASIYSRDIDRATKLAGRMRSGAVGINDGAAACAGSIEAPMGGMADSGLGRRHGVEGIRKYTEAQTVAVQRLVSLGPPAGMPVERFVGLANRQLGLLKRLRVR